MSRYSEAMAPLNIHLPDTLRSRVEARAAESGFDSVEAYVQAVLLADAAGGPVMDEAQIQSLLLQRVDGPFVDADFTRMRQKLNARLGGEGGSGAEPGPKP
jgi:hypothetical protein